MALVASTTRPLTHVAGASDMTLNASYTGAIALGGATLAVGTAAAGAPVIGVVGGLGLASGLAYVGYCDASGIDALAPWGSDDADASKSTDTQAVA